jgi:hypothetical protein
MISLPTEIKKPGIILALACRFTTATQAVVQVKPLARATGRAVYS